jgi:hypothetical protein
MMQLKRICFDSFIVLLYLSYWISNFKDRFMVEWSQLARLTSSLADYWDWSRLTEYNEWLDQISSVSS